MKINQEFIEELDKLIQLEYKEVYKLTQESKLKILSLSYEIFLSDDVLLKFELNKDIRFIITMNSSKGGTKYLYKNIELKPINYYIRPDDYHEVSTLEILQQCILQDTYKPDIMFLERGEKL